MSIFDLNSQLKKIKDEVEQSGLGMILVHNGVVRKAPKKGEGEVMFLEISYDDAELNRVIDETYKKNDGVKKVVVWINEGVLNVGDDIMFAIVAGDRRTNILKPFEELIEDVKNRVVKEKEKLLTR